MKVGSSNTHQVQGIGASTQSGAASSGNDLQTQSLFNPVNRAENVDNDQSTSLEKVLNILNINSAEAEKYINYRVSDFDSNQELESLFRKLSPTELNTLKNWFQDSSLNKVCRILDTNREEAIKYISYEPSSFDNAPDLDNLYQHLSTKQVGELELRYDAVDTSDTLKELCLIFKNKNDNMITQQQRDVFEDLLYDISRLCNTKNLQSSNCSNVLFDLVKKKLRDLITSKGQGNYDQITKMTRDLFHLATHRNKNNFTDHVPRFKSSHITARMAILIETVSQTTTPTYIFEEYPERYSPPIFSTTANAHAEAPGSIAYNNTTDADHANEISAGLIKKPPIFSRCAQVASVVYEFLDKNAALEFALTNKNIHEARKYLPEKRIARFRPHGESNHPQSFWKPFLDAVKNNKTYINGIEISSGLDNIAPFQDLCKAIKQSPHPITHLRIASFGMKQGWLDKGEYLDVSPNISDNDRMKFMFALSELENLTSLDLSGSNISGSYLESLSKLPNLEVLNLSDIPSLSTEDLSCLESFPKLKTLDLANTHRYYDMVHPRLGDYGEDLDNSVITESLPPNLSKLKHLENLNLSGRKLKLEDLENNISKVTSLKILSLAFCLELSDTDLRFFNTLTSLEKLSISGANITGEGFSDLTGLKLLTVLVLSHCNNFRDEGLKKLLQLQNLRELYIKECPEVSYSGISEHFDRCSYIDVSPGRNDGRITFDMVRTIALMNKIKDPYAKSVGPLLPNEWKYMTSIGIISL